jgi:hypothetical protein
MSARSEVESTLRELYVSHQGASAPWDKGCSTCDAKMVRVMEAVDTYVHALAERIRNENPDHDVDWSDGVDWAADLIDPNPERNN